MSANLDESFYHKILQNAQIETFKAGEFVVIQGDIGDKFFIILEGTVIYLINNASKTEELKHYRHDHAHEHGVKFSDQITTH